MKVKTSSFVFVMEKMTEESLCNVMAARHGITCNVLVSVASPSWGVKKTLGFAETV